jgi:NTP pyrophosphatase (non-canonical NTP hydrolase)
VECGTAAAPIRSSVCPFFMFLWSSAVHPLEIGDALDLRDAQREVDSYISQFKEGYFPPLVNLARLAEEVGELARELNHRYGKKTRKPDEPEGDVALELADILFVVIVLANQMQVDLQTAMERTLEKYRVRDADRWERKQAHEG